MHGEYPKLLSIIIPVYKQADTIVKNLKAILEELSSLPVPYEVIVVVDGYVDDSLKEAKKVNSSKLKIVGYQHNKGKGYAIRYGMAKSSGDAVGFIDAGGDIRESGISMMLEHYRWYKADIVVGSKRHI